MSKVRASALCAAALAIAAAGPLMLTPSRLLADDPAPAADPSNAATDQQRAAEFLQKVHALHWQQGPGTATLAGNSTIVIPKGSEFLGPPDSSTYIQLQGNPPSDNEYIFSSGDTGWFAVYGFDPSGYVKDNEKIDPDALLQTLKDQNAKDIEERKRLGMGALTLEGWYVPPHYDPTTHRLEWGTRLTDDTGAVILNYTVRILGRSGVTSVTLVSDPTRFDQDLASFKSTLNGYTFNPDQTYAAFQSGDKVAEYGLGALVVGGAAAVAAKAGLPFLKFIFVGIAAAGASVMAFFRRLFGRKTPQPPKPTL